MRKVVFSTLILLSLYFPALNASAVENNSISELQEMMTSGKLTSVELTEYYLLRIEKYDKGENGIHAIISINPNAMEEAGKLDEERRKHGSRGPLHGIPVIIKDNIETGDGLATTNGSLLLKDYLPVRDAFLVEKLRQAGALILGKSNLSEWANMRSSDSIGGWSAIGGLVHNPYDRTRNACGSSAGSAAGVAAGFAAGAVGTETDGSIICPAAVTGVVGFKPTMGLISRRGIILLAHHQDHVGSLAGTVEGAVLLFQAMAGFDPEDAFAVKGRADYSQYLKRDGLKGKTLGIVRSLMGKSTKVDLIFESQLAVLKQQGATISDHCNIDSYREMKEAEKIVMYYEFKANTNKFLEQAKLPGLNSLSDLIEKNRELAEQELRWFGQNIFESANQSGPLTDERYLQALTDSKRLAGREGIDAALAKCKADILIAPTARPAWKNDMVNGSSSGGTSSSPAAVAGYPHITVPMGFVEGLPVAISFFAGKLAEPMLIEAAYSYEQATMHRKPPVF